MPFCEGGFFLIAPLTRYYSETSELVPSRPGRRCRTHQLVEAFVQPGLVLDASLPAGNYIIVVGGWESNAGEYAVTMRCPQSRAGFVDGTVRCDQTVVGSTVSVGSHTGEGAGDHIYRFKTNEGATAVHFNSCASDYDTCLRVMNPGTQ